jgi:hypothetical protein
LHNEGHILVAVPLENIQLGNGNIEYLLGKVTCMVRAVENFVGGIPGS